MSSFLSRIDTAKLWPVFLNSLQDMLAALEARGATYKATCGYRSFQEQATLYFQGRTVPGQKVTNARPGYSAHNFGLAVDFVAVLPSGEFSWDVGHYDALGEEAERHGLVWGGSFKSLPDRPHVQWPGYVTGAELASLRGVYLTNLDNPLPAVWALLDEEEPTRPPLPVSKGVA